jgi:hypothetical protein
MWTYRKVCDCCRLARAAIETETGFFLCRECEATIVITFQEFELPGVPDDRGLGGRTSLFSP